MNIDARTTSNPRYAKFSCRLAKIAQTAQNKHATGNAIVAMATPTRDFLVKSLLQFLQIFREPQLRSYQKAHEQTFPTIHCPYGNIMNFSRTSQIHFCFKNTLKNAVQTEGDEKRPKPFFPLRHIDLHLIHPSLDRPQSPPQSASRSNQPFCHSTASGQTDRWARR